MKLQNQIETIGPTYSGPIETTVELEPSEHKIPAEAIHAARLMVEGVLKVGALDDRVDVGKQIDYMDPIKRYKDLKNPH